MPKLKMLSGVAALALMTAVSAVNSALAGQLVYWSMWNETEPQAAAIKEIIGKYTAANPDTKISVVWNGRQNQTKLRAAIAAGTAVDLMDQDSDQLAGDLNGLYPEFTSQILPPKI